MNCESWRLIPIHSNSESTSNCNNKAIRNPHNGNLSQYNAINAAILDVREGKSGPVPIHLRDGSYAGAKRLGHGKGYKYAHDAPNAVAQQNYLPDNLAGVEYYAPTDRGHEAEFATRLARLRALIRGESL